MKYLDQAAINYGKAIDARPEEKYFLAPQKRIETAIVHYKELEDQLHPKPAAVAVAPPAAKPLPWRVQLPARAVNKGTHQRPGNHHGAVRHGRQHHRSGHPRGPDATRLRSRPRRASAS